MPSSTLGCLLSGSVWAAAILWSWYNAHLSSSGEYCGCVPVHVLIEFVFLHRLLAVHFYHFTTSAWASVGRCPLYTLHGFW